MQYAFSQITFTAKENIDKLKQAEIKVNETIQSTCFNDFLTQPKFRSKLVQTNGLSRSQVVEKIKSTTLTVPVVYYFKNNSVIGYRQPPFNTIYLNKKYHDKYSACSSAANLAHEASHVLGFTHDFKATKRRPFSVPYSISHAFSFCCK